MSKVSLSPIAFVLSEFAMNNKLTHGQFRRLVQLAMLPKNGGKPSLVPKQIAELTGTESAPITQALCELEQMGIVKRVGNTRGAYEINTNKDEWFPAQVSEQELALKKELELLEQMKIETMGKIKNLKSGGVK